MLVASRRYDDSRAAFLVADGDRHGTGTDPHARLDLIAELDGMDRGTRLAFAHCSGDSRLVSEKKIDLITCCGGIFHRPDRAHV